MQDRGGAIREIRSKTRVIRKGRNDRQRDP